MIPLISAIILAAGKSRRMGEPKQLIPLGKTTILERTVDNFLNSEAHDVIVVVGYRTEEVISLVAAFLMKRITKNASASIGAGILAGLMSATAYVYLAVYTTHALSLNAWESAVSVASSPIRV